MSRKVVITGIGVISPLGNSHTELWQALQSGRSGLQLLPDTLNNGIPTVAGQCQFDSSQWFSKMQLSGMDRVSQFAVAAADMALTDAGLTCQDLTEAGIYMGCGMGGALAIEQAYKAHFETHTRLSPLSVVAGMTNAPAAQISMRFKVQGPVMTYSVACASSAIAIGEAARAIARGDIDTAFAGGADALLGSGIIHAWQAMHTLAKPDPDHPEASCKAFSSDRSGLVLAEGSAVLILEEAAAAKARGATIYAELAGFGISADASHLTKPDASGQQRALKAALKSANLEPADIRYCNTHGTATQVGDEVEAQALSELFGQTLFASSTKTLHGHLLGAAGALEAAITTLTVHHQQMPAGIAHLPQDPKCPLQLVTADNRNQLPAPTHAISNSFAFGGTNAVLVFSQHV